MKIKLIGNGRMGTEFKKIYADEVIENFAFSNKLIYSKVDSDVIIDFSHPDNLEYLLLMGLKNHTPIVIGTTSYTLEQEKMIKNASKYIPICYEHNFSLGIIQLKGMIRQVANFYKEVIIVDIHHKSKKDIPSGTALDLKEYILKINPNIKLRIDSIRKGRVNGIHKVIFISNDEELILMHQVNNRSVFVKGAYLAATRLIKKNNDLFSFEELIDEQ